MCTLIHTTYTCGDFIFSKDACAAVKRGEKCNTIEPDVKYRGEPRKCDECVARLRASQEYLASMLARR
jgi:hypothetical protein